MAHSPYKQTVINFVSVCPGCTKMDVAKHVTRSARRAPNKQYYIVDTAIRNGWIKAKWAGNRYSLTVPQAAN